MKPYRVQGTFRMGRTTTPFTIETFDADENGARERVISTIGSRHRVGRRMIEVTKVEAIAPDQVQDLAIQHRIEKGA